VAVGEVVVVGELKCPSLGGGDHMPSFWRYYNRGCRIEIDYMGAFKVVSRGIFFLGGYSGRFQVEFTISC
jgi:hypothetical protein